MTERRQLGLAAAIAAVTGEAIALGIFLTPATMAKSLGSPLLLAAGTAVCLQRRRSASGDDENAPAATVFLQRRRSAVPGKFSVVTGGGALSGDDGILPGVATPGWQADNSPSPEGPAETSAVGRSGMQ
jgi:hypothetical protein